MFNNQDKFQYKWMKIDYHFSLLFSFSVELRYSMTLLKEDRKISRFICRPLRAVEYVLYHLNMQREVIKKAKKKSNYNNLPNSTFPVPNTSFPRQSEKH